MLATPAQVARLATELGWTHEPYANPVNGGHDGYQARCHAPGCDWAGDVFPPGQEGKLAAKREARTHGTGPSERGLAKAEELLRKVLSERAA